MPWGDKATILDEKPHRLRTGDTVLIGCDLWHSFSSPKEGVVEDISAAHVAGGSEHEERNLQERL